MLYMLAVESNLQIFDGVKTDDICGRNHTDTEVKNFTEPVMTQFIRVVPLKWEGFVSPCLRLELYGCYVKGY